MGSIRIDVESVQGIAQSIKNASDNGFAEVNSLSSRIDPQAVWTGNASRSYQAAVDRWKNAQRELHQALGDMGREVQNIADNFDAIDRTSF